MIERKTAGTVDNIVKKAEAAKQEVAKMADVNMTLIQASLTKNWAQVPEPTRVNFVYHLCDKLGIHPVLNPFRFIDMKGVLVLYADKRVASLIANANKISTEITKEVFDKEKQILKIYVRAVDPHGVYTDEFAAIHLGSNAGEIRANLEMKCLTKAKRRAILALKDLSVPDEEELEYIRSALESGNSTVATITAKEVEDQIKPPADVVEIDETATAQEEVMDTLTGGDAKKVGFMNTFIANHTGGKKLADLTFDECHSVIAEHADLQAEVDAAKTKAKAPEREPGDEEQIPLVGDEGNPYLQGRK